MTGPAFASALAKMEALKAAAKEMGESVGSITLGMNPEEISAFLVQLKNKMQALGIADIADVNVQPGVLITRLNFLKRLIQQAKISDLLDINANTGAIEDELTKLGHLSEDIPVNFDVGSIPHLGLTQSVTAGISPSDLASLRTAQLDFQALGLEMSEVSAKMGVLSGDTMQSAHDFSTLGLAADQLLGKMMNMNYDYAMLGPEVKKTNAALVEGIPPMSQWAWWGALNAARMVTFGGALKGIPFVGAVSALHLLADAAIEIAAVWIPATIAVIAFGVAAAPTFQHIYVQMKNVWSASQALGQSIYPVTSAMESLGNAVKPEVYLLFGQALVLAGKEAGAFSKLAAATGSVIDQLGARFVNAVTSGNGFNTFMTHAVSDVSGLGNSFGDLFGIIGNLLHSMPGYAQILLGVGQGILGLAEDITSSGIVQGFLKAGLYVHGFIVYMGLAVTAAVFLGNALLGLGAKIGLVGDDMVLFDSASFANGLRLAFSGVVDLAGGLIGLGAAEDVATAGARVMGGTMEALGAISPFGWAVLAAGAIAGLIFWLHGLGSATKTAITSMQDLLSATPVGSLGPSIIAQQASAIKGLAAAQIQLNQAEKAQASTDPGSKFPTQVLQSSIAVQHQSQVVSAASGYLHNYSDVLRAAGGNVAFLSAANITSNQILTASGEQLKELEIEAMAAADSFKAMALGTGRAGAAMNALNYSGDTTSNMLGSMDVDMNNVITGQDDLTNVVLGSEQAFIKFQIQVENLSGYAKAAGASIGGLNSASLTLAQGFYTSALPAMQNVIDALELQLPTTQQLTEVISTQAKELIPYAGNNTLARDSIVSLINNALGPGTVSLQTLNKWVNKNSVSAQEMAKDIAEATIKAGILGQTLSTMVTGAFSASVLGASGFDKALKTLQTDMANDAPSQTLAADAQNVYDSLIRSGIGAGQAKGDVDSYFKALGLIPPKVITSIVANVAAAEGAINGVIAMLEDINGRTSTVFVNTVAQTFTAPGGRIGHSASGGAASGLTVVGEQGWEIVDLPVGSHVYSNAQSKSMLTQAAPPPTTVVQLQIGGGTGNQSFDAFMLKWIQGTVRTKGGGDVQATFGGLT
jgi:hypothetical protein